MSIFEVMFDVRSIQVTEKTEQREKKLYAMALQKPYYTVNANQQFEKLCIFLTYVSIWVFAEVFVFTISIRHVAAHTNQNNWNEKYQIFVAKKNSGKKTLRRVFSFEVFFFSSTFFLLWRRCVIHSHMHSNTEHGSHVCNYTGEYTSEQVNQSYWIRSAH